MNTFNTLTIYRSSAGSGKTYTLVKEYLKLALSYPAGFSQILAITFTNKATDEMKSRIIETLVEFTEDKSEVLKNELKELLNVTEEQFTQNSRKLLALILHNYSDFAVCTIDSFFSRVMRSLAKEMQLPLRFDTELNLDAVITEITTRLLLEAGKDTRITAWLEEFIISKMNDDKGWNIERELYLVAKELFKEDFRAQHKPEETISAEFLKELRSIKNSFEKTMQSNGETFLKTIHANNFAVADFAYGKSGVAGYLEKITRRIKPKEYEPGKRVLEANENPEKWCSKTAAQKDLLLSLVESDLRFILEAVVAHYQNNATAYLTAIEVLNLIYIAGIASSLDAKLKAYRDENDVLLITDINLLLKEFISGEDAPFIYEKTGSRYRHFMIDEFQDTSAFQWSNMVPLVDNALAGGASAMMVGDAKQSIYRWRGGKMQLLLNGIQENLFQYKAITSVKNLNTNYRSKKEVIDFNNLFFSNAPFILPTPVDDEELKKDLAAAYHIDDVKQKVSAKHATGGYVEFTFYKKKQNDTEDNTPDTALTFLLSTLNRLKEQGYEEKDICIIVRKNAHGNEIATFLFENGFPKVVSSESLLLNAAPQIIFIINLMKVLNNADDKIARAACLHYHLTQKSSEPKTEGHAIFKIVNDTKLFFAALPEAFSVHYSLLKKLPLFELTEQLIAAFQLNNKPDAYLQRFEDVVLEYLEKNAPSLSAFIEWWEENKESDKTSVIVPSDENAINIISIHKSKGLQFPVVIMPYPDWELKPKHDNVLWVHSGEQPYAPYSLLPVKTNQLLEKTFFKEAYQKEVQQTLVDNLNLLYVAFTRAEERLYVFCEEGKVESMNRTAHLIQKTILSAVEWNENITAEDGIKKFVKGSETVKVKTEQLSDKETSFDNPEIISLTTYNSTAWQNKLVLAVNKNKISVADDEGAAKSDFGILVHKLFSKIIKTQDAETVLERFITSGIISLNQKTEFEKLIATVLKVCEPHQWFTGAFEIKTEPEIILPDGSIIRPDRVMIKNNKLILLDYKTGDEQPEHAVQLNGYATILMQAGYTEVKKYLLYVNSGKLTEV